MANAGMVGGGVNASNQNPGQSLMGHQTPALVAQLQQRHMPSVQTNMMGGQQQQQQQNQQYSHQSQQY